MKSGLFLLTFITTFSLNLCSQGHVEVYISSKDCLKCTSGLFQVIRYCNAKGISNINIFTDYRSSQKRIQVEFPELPDSIFVIDKSIIARVIPDNKSKCLFKDNFKTTEELLLTDAYKLNPKEAQPRTLKPNSILTIKDTIFESGNYRAVIQGDNVLLFQKNLQYYLHLRTIGDTIYRYVVPTKITKELYDRSMGLIAQKEGKHVFDFDSASEINKRVKLPTSTIESFCLDGDTIFQYRNVYFYIEEDKENLSNKGFVFLSRVPLSGSEENVVESIVAPIEPFLLNDSIKVGFYIFYNHQRLENDRFFSYYTLLDDDAGKAKMAGRYLGCEYEISENGIKIIKNHKLKNLVTPDSLQSELRRFLYGNNPKIIETEDEKYIFYRNFGKLLSMDNGSLIDMKDFIEQKTRKKNDFTFSYIFDLTYHNGNYKLAYRKNDNKPDLYYMVFKNGRQPIEYKLDHTGNIDLLSIQGDKLTILEKKDEKNILEIKRFDL